MNKNEWPDNLWGDICNNDFWFQRLHFKQENEGAIPMLYLPNLDTVISAELDERNQKVILMRYKQGMTYKAIGNILGVGVERIRQMIVHSLRRLREPRCLRQLVAVPESAVVQLRNEIQKLTNQQEDLKKEIERLFGELEARKIKKRMQLPLSTPVDELGITTRSRNALILGGIKTVGALVELKESDLLSYRNLGQSCLADIKEALEKYDYELKPED